MKDRRTSVPELLDDADLIELNVPLGPLRQGAVSGYAPAGSTEESELEELSSDELEEFGSGARILPHPAAYAAVPRGSLPLEVEPRHAPPPAPTGRHRLPDLTVPPPVADVPGARPPQTLPPLGTQPPPESNDRRGVWIALVLLAAVGLGAALGFYVRSQRDVIRVEVVNPIVEEPPQVAPPAPEAEATAPATTEAQEPVAAEEAEVPEQEPVAEPKTSKPATRASKERTVATAPAPKQVQKPTEVTRAPEPKPAPVAAPEAPTLPESLSREQVKAGFETARDGVAACADGQYGVARVSATVTGAGRVTYALVSGDFQGTPAGSCMARAVRKAKFPQFSGDAFTVEYPYAMR